MTRACIATCFKLTLACLLAGASSLSCATGGSDSEFFGKVTPPAGQWLRYISGSEPESLDPQIGSGQPEARLYMALFSGLTEYDPKDLHPIPDIAERWTSNNDSSEFLFFLRKDAKWSNGDPITAGDFVYSLRRGLTPALASRSAYLAYYVKYAEAYNEAGMFVREPATGAFLLEQDVTPQTAATQGAKPEAGGSAAGKPVDAALQQHPELAKGESLEYDSPFHHFMHEPPRVVLASDEKDRAKQLKANPLLNRAIQGKELVPVKPEDVGIEAIDDQTLRITLTQSAPFFVSVLSHQFFRTVPRKAVEKYGDAWTQIDHIITSGPFKLETWKPYDEIDMVRNPMYWDATNVKLDRISFYPLEDLTTMMNLYKAGEVDAVFNHVVPVAWLDVVRPKKDYMDAPEADIEYYVINTKKPPMDDRRVRKAFNMAIDKNELAKFRRVAKPLTAFTPEGIFPDYPQPKGDPFDPEKAKQLLLEAGYKDASGKYDPRKFPIDKVDLTYNTVESNRAVAEFVQAQWKQNLGLTVPLKNMEFKTFLQYRGDLQYKGVARGAWVADYMDPFTFLNLFYTPAGDNGTGWWDQKYVDKLDEANRQLDAKKRYALLAEAEAYMLDQQPVIPLLTTGTDWTKKPYVKGMYPNPQTLHPWKFVFIEHDQAKWDYGPPNMAS